MTPGFLPICVVPTYANCIEAKSFQFFIEKTLDNFQTFFPDELWNTRILQVAQTEDCIKNGVVALSHFHRLYLTHQQWQSVDSVPALKHYNLAIKDLLAPASKSQSQNHVLVISCLIFICIEVCSRSQTVLRAYANWKKLLQGKTESAIGLFKYGCSMIQQYKKPSSCESKTKRHPCSDAEQILTLAETCFKRVGVQILTVGLHCFIRYHFSMLTN